MKGAEKLSRMLFEYAQDDSGPSSDSSMVALVSYRICRFKEITPETGPPSGTEDSLARDSRRTCTLPGAGRPSITFIWDSGILGSSLSSQRMLGEGIKSPSEWRSFRRKRLRTPISWSGPDEPLEPPKEKPGEARLMLSPSVTMRRSVVPRGNWSGTHR